MIAHRRPRRLVPSPTSSLLPWSSIRRCPRIAPNKTAEMSTTTTLPDRLPLEQSTESFWHSEPSKRLMGHRTTRDLPSEANVVIVGSGITAAGAAWRLLRNPVSQARQGEQPPSVVMLEAREACWGATGRNGGHIFPILHDYVEDDQIGSFELENLRAIEALIRGLDIHCDYQRQTSVRAIYTKLDLEEIEAALCTLKEKYPALASHVRLVTDHGELVRLRIPSAIAATMCDKAARLWPYKFVTRLLEDLVFPAGDLDSKPALNLQTTTPVISLCPTASALGARSWEVVTGRKRILRQKAVSGDSLEYISIASQHSPRRLHDRL